MRDARNCYTTPQRTVFHARTYLCGASFSSCPFFIKMRVTIIGAGASGLPCIKACNDDGLEPVCFEAEDEIGGLWHFTEEERHSSVYRSTVINTSKEMMCYSDFPIPMEFPPFMHHGKVIEYLHLYAKAFDMYKFIRFRTKVVEIRLRRQRQMRNSFSRTKRGGSRSSEGRDLRCCDAMCRPSLRTFVAHPELPWSG